MMWSTMSLGNATSFQVVMKRGVASGCWTQYPQWKSFLSPTLVISTVFCSQLLRGTWGLDQWGRIWLYRPWNWFLTLTLLRCSSPALFGCGVDLECFMLNITGCLPLWEVAVVVCVTWLLPQVSSQHSWVSAPWWISLQLAAHFGRPSILCVLLPGTLVAMGLCVCVRVCACVCVCLALSRASLMSILLYNFPIQDLSVMPSVSWLVSLWASFIVVFRPSSPWRALLPPPCSVHP